MGKRVVRRAAQAFRALQRGVGGTMPDRAYAGCKGDGANAPDDGSQVCDEARAGRR